MLAQDNAAAGFAKEQLGAGEELIELLQVFECDASCVRRLRRGSIEPSARVAEVFWVRMMCEVPVEIAARPRLPGELFDEVAAWHRDPRILVGVDGPEVRERHVHTSSRAGFADRGICDSHLPDVVGDEHVARHPSDVVPLPVDVHFVADDVAGDAPVLVILPGVVIGEELHCRSPQSLAARRHRVESGDLICELCVACGVEDCGVHGGVASLVGEDDEIDADAEVAHLFHRKAVEVAPAKRERLALAQPSRVAGLFLQIDERAERDVDPGVPDADGDGVVHHLHLQPLLAVGLWEGPRVLHLALKGAGKHDAAHRHSPENRVRNEDGKSARRAVVCAVNHGQRNVGARVAFPQYGRARRLGERLARRELDEFHRPGHALRRDDHSVTLHGDAGDA